MRYTLGQAAKATGLSKMTIQRALKTGRISGEKDETGSYQIDPAELHRIFPAVTAGDGNTPVSMGRSETPTVDVELRVAHARLEAVVASLKTMLEDVRIERDRWHAQAERLALAAPPPTPVPSTVPAVRGVPGRSWWPWRRSA